MTRKADNSTQSYSSADRAYNGSSYQEVRDAIFANPYYNIWRAGDRFGLPVYAVTFRSVVRGIVSRCNFQFKNASKRTVDSKADLRWGTDLRGQRRLLHPNGVCLTGLWEVDDDADYGYTGYFKKASKGRVIARYSTCCTETRRNRNRSLSLVGKIYPMEEESKKIVPANFITQEDLGGTKTGFVNDAELRNAPHTTFWRRGWGIPILMLTGLTFKFADQEVTQRQLYEIAELGKGKEETRAPKFMRLKIARSQERVDGHVDFRDEIMAHIFDSGDPDPKRKLVFNIEVSDKGGEARGTLLQRRKIPEDSWRLIGRITFDDAVVSYNGDFVIHFHHPAWREDRNDPETVARKRVT